MAETSRRSLTDLPRTLGVAQVETGVYVGRYRGFPIGIEPNLPAESPTESALPQTFSVLAQLRYVGPADDFMPSADAITDARVRNLVETGDARISFDETYARLSSFRINVDDLHRCIDAMIDTVKKAGGSGNGDTCHYCRANAAPTLTWVEARVAQVCPDCLEKKLKEASDEKYGTPAGLVHVLLLTIPAILAGAIFWGLAWWLDSRILRWVAPHHKEIRVPSEYVIAEVLIIGILAGAFVGYIVGHARKAGRLARVLAGGMSMLAAVAVGDVAYIKAHAYADAVPVSLIDIVRTLPQYWHTLGRDIPYRVATLAVSVVIAMILANMPQPE